MKMLTLYLNTIDYTDDKEKFEKLYIKYRSKMYYVAMSVLHDRYDAEDALHNAFIAVEKNINKIVYNRPVTEDGNVTEKSGQYLPKYIFAIKEFYKLSSDAKRLDIKKRPLFVFLSNKSASAEHFFINQSYNFEFVYGNNRKATIPCPKKLKKYISYSANYLYVNYEDNASMEELSIFDKIQFLKAKGKSVFSCSWCNKYFLKAREIFLSLFSGKKIITQQFAISYNILSCFT